MKLFSKTTTFVLGGLLTAAVLFGTKTTAASPSANVADLASYNDSYNEIIANYDMDGFLDLYTNNPLWIAPTEAPVSGLEVPRNTFGFITAKKGNLSHTADHTFFSKDGSQAVLIGQYDVEIAAVGKKGTGTYLFVLEREGDGWKIVVDMFNEHKSAP